MISKNIDLLKKIKTKTIKINDFSVGQNSSKDENSLKENFAQTVYNIDFSSGALKSGIGVKNVEIQYELYDSVRTKSLTIPEDVVLVERVWTFRRFDSFNNIMTTLILMYAENDQGQKNIYWNMAENNSQAFYKLNGLSFSKAPKAFSINVQGADYMVFLPTISGDLLYVYDGLNQIGSYNFFPCVDGTFYDGKLFVIPKNKKNTIWVSNNSNASSFFTNTMNGTEITFSDTLGEIYSIFHIGRTIYLVRENGITQIQIADSFDDYKYKTIPITGYKIYKNTICLCEDNIVMLTNTGICVFDGLEFKKLSFGFDELIDENNTNCFGICADGKYYLSLNMKDLGITQELACSGQKNNTLLIVDLNKNTYIVSRGIDISFLCPLNYEYMIKVLVCINGENKIGELALNGLNFETPTKKVWESSTIQFDDDKTQVLRTVSFVCRYPASLYVFVDGNKNVFNILGLQQKTRLNINLRGESFKVAFVSTNAQFYISNLSMEFVK